MKPPVTLAQKIVEPREPIEITPTGYMVYHPKKLPAKHDDSPDGERWSADHFLLHGISHPTIFSTFRGARKEQVSAARRWGGVAPGLRDRSADRHVELSKILLFDARYLPELAEDECMRMEKFQGKRGVVEPRPVYPGLMDRLSELEEAERQFEIWGARVEELRKAAGL